MTRLFFEDVPQAKARHRSGIRGGKTFIYDPQKAHMDKIRIMVGSKLKAQGVLKPLQGPVELGVRCWYPFPKSWPKNRIKEVIKNGSLKTSKPDADNIQKFYADILTGIAYKDDSQIARFWIEKLYSHKPGVELTINSIGVSMINEHAITIQNNCSIEDIDYLVRKANTIGKMNRKIHRIFCADTDEGSHIYFEVDDLMPISERSKY